MSNQLKQAADALAKASSLAEKYFRGGAQSLALDPDPEDREFIDRCLGLLDPLKQALAAYEAAAKESDSVAPQIDGAELDRAALRIYNALEHGKDGHTILLAFLAKHTPPHASKAVTLEEVEVWLSSQQALPFGDVTAGINLAKSVILSQRGKAKGGQ